jgi:hypothetical protein
MLFVQCSACGTPAGVTEYEDTSDVAREATAEQNEKIDQMGKRLGDLIRSVDRLADALARK